MDVLNEADRRAVQQIQTAAFSRLLPMPLEPTRDAGLGDEPTGQPARLTRALLRR
jgi:hypothetical protein